MEEHCHCMKWCIHDLYLGLQLLVEPVEEDGVALLALHVHHLQCRAKTRQPPHPHGTAWQALSYGVHMTDLQPRHHVGRALRGAAVRLAGWWERVHGDVHLHLHRATTKGPLCRQPVSILCDHSEARP